MSAAHHPWQHVLRWRISNVSRSQRRHLSSSRQLFQEQHKKRASPHAQFYSDLVPGMIPIALLGSALYLGLQLLQSRLSHEKYLDEERARVEQLEAEVDALCAERDNRSPSTAHDDGRPVAENAGSGLSSPQGWFRWFKQR